MNNNIQCSLESSTTKINLNSIEDGIFLQPELAGLTGLPEIRTSSGVNAGYDGGWTSAQYYDARSISINGVIVNRDVTKLEETRRKLVSLCGQGRKESLKLNFVTEAGNAYTVFVRTTGCEMSLQRVKVRQEFLLQFRADDPLIYDDGASSGTAAILHVQNALGGFEINFELPLLIGGGADVTTVENGPEMVYPVINLYGPLHTPKIVNQTTNQQLQISADLATNDVVTIDSQARTITLNGADIYYLKTEGSEFIEIAAGDNQLYLTSEQTSDTGYAEVKFKQGYLSI